MFTNILHRPALAIVISIILLFLGVLGIKTLGASDTGPGELCGL
jgi:HAE1 family hydrophobic/amphiphilic exporter-1